MLDTHIHAVECFSMDLLTLNAQKNLDCLLSSAAWYSSILLGFFKNPVSVRVYSIYTLC